METAVVIPVGPGRLQNLVEVLDTLAHQTKPVRLVVLVCDGPEAKFNIQPQFKIPTLVVDAPKFEPGKGEQPRNFGVRMIREFQKANNPLVKDVTHVWFLDTDIMVRARAHEFYAEAQDLAVKAGVDPGRRVMCGPYDWLPPGERAMRPELKNDPRWPSFEEHGPEVNLTENLFAGLACFSGNLVWNIEEFVRIGGFWNDLHHGRCEDGELGLRAVATGVPIAFVGEARGWHLHHKINANWAGQTNARDVPMLNERHPWVELGQGGLELFVVDEDGKRFNARCECGWEGNTMEIWEHRATHLSEQEPGA